MNKILMIFGLVLVVGLVGCTQLGQDENTVTTTTMAQESSYALPDEGSFSVNTDMSTLKWYAEKIVGSSHDGEVPISAGELVIDDGSISGEFVIDMAGMTADGSGVLDHLKNEDFFNVEVYPTSTFVIKDISKVNGQYIVTGDLTILNATNEISFPAVFSGDGNIRAQASFSIDRTRWGIIYGSGSFFKEMGDKAIRDNIDYELDIVFE